MWTIRQTDCRTGWQVISPSGSIYLTVRRRETATEIMRDMNATTNQ